MAGPAYTTFTVYGTLFKVDVRYQFIAALGRGSYGIVCSAKDVATGEKVAIKRVSPMARKTSDAKHTLREISLMQCLGNHPNIVSIKDMCVNVADDELYIIMDFMDTDMHRVIQSSQALSDSHHRYFLHQVLRGVKHMHDNGILHRDLKPGNILVTKSCQVKIADFGLARTCTRSSEKRKGRPASASITKVDGAAASESGDWQPMTEHVVTRWYRAPELMLQPDGHYSTGVDMWSIGCIFAEMLGRKAIFPGKNFIHQLTLIFDVIGTPCTSDVKKMKSAQAQRFIKSLGKKPKVPFRTVFPSATPEAIDLLERMLHFDPVSRCSVDEALKHPYMQAIERRYTPKDVTVPTHISFAFEQENLGRNELVQLIVSQVEGFSGRSSQTPASIRTIHALAQQSRGRVTLESPELMKSMMAEPTMTEVPKTTRPPSASRIRSAVVTPGPKPNANALLTATSIATTSTTATTSTMTAKPRPASAHPTRAPPPMLPTRTTLVCKEADNDGDKEVEDAEAKEIVPAKPLGPASDSSSSSDDEADAKPVVPATVARPKSAPIRGGSALKHAAPCVASTSSLIRAQRANQAKPTTTTTTTSGASAKPAPLTRTESATEILPAEAETKGKGKKLTVPVSPKFSVMSWQKQKKPAAATRSTTRVKKIR
ncbi:CMGC/MAPK protein kinase [Saprolegnia diclina VS20]|uniref:CMGC/MAPK protein kinase n=1 Tax=Saprolegnia diclina (strain VS20) TaxID=1156394 RepID=T0SDS7_SAPDV|nr:CMGC/MAPK protein kinase [Saprolegnia diclina VS20]EQC40987.1 CMGC/MAPK protein kinase [Saprolegnia diclina VS20]|eukprot:XP_008605831.1 CMGC/MAPK protein kinase [Saprolegnia diclina VS20]